MQIVTIIEDNPITGIRYGTVDISEYNNNTKRRIDRNNRLRKRYYNRIQRKLYNNSINRNK